MSIATEITRLQNAKASIKTSIENKGVTVPSSTKLDGYSALIDSIQTGGGGISVDDIAQNLQPSGAITLSDSVTKIGDYAFAGKPITSVYGKNVTNIMGSHAFTGSTITSITDSDFPSLGVDDRYIVLLSLPDSCTSIKLSGTRIALSSGSSALRDCKGLVTAEQMADLNSGVLGAHPTFFYESMWSLLGFLLINAYYKRKKYHGEVFFMYITWYGFGRFWIEGLRTDSLYVGPIRISQLIGIVCAIVGGAFLVINYFKKVKGAQPILVAEGRVDEKGKFIKTEKTEEAEADLKEEKTDKTDKEEKDNGKDN